MNFFITGIGTNVGKTIVAAILTEALQADYWKPVQSGTSEGLDSETVKSIISNNKTKIHPETYLLKEPLSPHFAAKLENITIDLSKIELPETSNHLIIEGAGGLLVPLNEKDYVIDIAKKFDLEVVLVISSYLGCINHSLLSINYLIRNNFKINALVFNGEFEAQVKSAILNAVKKVKVIDIPHRPEISRDEVLTIANALRGTF